MESLVWLSILLILDSGSSVVDCLISSAAVSMLAHSALIFAAVCSDMRISPIPMENPCPANHK